MENKPENHDIPLPARFGQSMGIASQLYSELITRLLEPEGLTYPQFMVLLHLARRHDSTRVSDIVRAVNLTQSAVTKIVQKFRTLGWLTTRDDMNDHRSRKVEISPEGRAQVAAIQRRFGGAFEVLLKDWSNSDLNRFTSDLQKLIKRMEEMRTAAQP